MRPGGGLAASEERARMAANRNRITQRPAGWRGMIYALTVPFVVRQKS